MFRLIKNFSVKNVFTLYLIILNCIKTEPFQNIFIKKVYFSLRVFQIHEETNETISYFSKIVKNILISFAHEKL